jgi:Arc/MetJ-type ribon-helix-helix transcriptional regulator
MTAVTIAISIDPSLLERMDALVGEKRFRSRREVFPMVVREQIARFDEEWLGVECAKNNPAEEQVFADIGLSSDLSKALRRGG